jgi:hypothetical protein
MLSKNRRFPNRWMLYVSKEELSASERLVWRCINDHQGTSNSGYPSLSTIAAECGLSVSTAKRCRASLETKGLLKVVPGREGRSNRYNCVIPQEWIDRVPADGQSHRKRQAHHEPELRSSWTTGGSTETPRIGSQSASKGSGGKNHLDLSDKGSRTTSPDSSSSPPPKSAPDVDKKGYPVGEAVFAKLGFTGYDEFSWRLFWSTHDDPELKNSYCSPQQLQDFLYWFPGQPSKAKGGRPYWSFVDSFPLFTKHWDQMFKQMKEDLYDQKRRRAKAVR